MECWLAELKDAKTTTPGLAAPGMPLGPCQASGTEIKTRLATGHTGDGLCPETSQRSHSDTLEPLHNSHLSKIFLSIASTFKLIADIEPPKMPVPRTEAQGPARQEPMEASAPATSDAVVTQQPVSILPDRLHTRAI